LRHFQVISTLILFLSSIILTPHKGFKSLVICSTSFTGVDVVHVSEMIKLLGKSKSFRRFCILRFCLTQNSVGATYDQYLKAGVSVLICGSPTPNEEKLAFAKDKDIPAVSSQWLWACIDAGRCMPFDDYLIPNPTSLSASATTVKTISMPLIPSDEAGSDR
jgi:hypothetical protein